MKNRIIIVCLLLLSNLLSPNLFAEAFRISPEALKEKLNDKQLIILDTRLPQIYRQGHIKNAVNFPVGLTYHNQNVNGKISQPEITQENFRKHGLEKNSEVVVYDNGDLVDAARLFWLLEVYGLTNVKVLDQGYDRWLDQDYPISLKDHHATPSQYIATINHKRLASKFTTQIATRNANQLVIDARGKPHYTGEKSSAKRFGHIPTAINIPFSHNFSVNNGFTSLKPLSELEKVYTDIPKDKKLVLYCSVGRVSASNYLALRELGYDVANYDSSWNEWGNDFKLPIEK